MNMTIDDFNIGANELKKCNIENCLNKYFCKGYCNIHYTRIRKYNNPNFTKIVKGESRKKNPLYKTWYDMKARCYNINHKSYKDYGGRGIKVSDAWFNLAAFCLDMGSKPTNKHTLERDKVNENYSKKNCRWATKHEQAANRRNNNKNVGVYNSKRDNYWVASLKVNNKCYQKYFKTENEAINYRKTLEKLYLI